MPIAQSLGAAGAVEHGTLDQSTIDRILADPKSKEFRDLRDRAAYMFITGTHPSHLRTFFTRALTMISRMHSGPVSLDGRSGSLKLDERIVASLDLPNHPMVQEVQGYIAQGWRIQPSRGPNERKPFTKVFMFRGAGAAEEHMTVQIDGSVKGSWD